MKSFPLSFLLLLAAMTLTATPTSAQFVAIPVTGNFSLTNTGEGNQYVGGKPTLLTPVGTIHITSADPGAVRLRGDAAGLITTDTASSAYFPVGGSTTLNDNRTASFDYAMAYVEGRASITGAESLSVGYRSELYSISPLPVNSVLAFTITSGALYVPAANFSQPTPQFQVPVTGGNFRITDPVGTSPGVMTVNAVLTPLGTTNLTIALPTLSILADPGRPRFSVPSLVGRVGGIANGTIAFHDGRTVSVTDQLLSLDASFMATGQPAGGTYFYDSQALDAPVTITGRITGGSISVPLSAAPVPPTASQPQSLPSQVEPVLVQLATPSGTVAPQPVQVTSAVVPAAPQPVGSPAPEFVLGFASDLNLGGEPESYLKLVESDRVPVAPEDLPEVEQSSLAVSRLHPAVNVYQR